MDFKIQNLKQSNEFLNAILDNITSAVFILDENVRMHAVNPIFETLFNTTSKEILGELCGNAIGCHFAVRENKDCGTASYCSKCNLRKSLLKSFENKEGVYKEKFDRKFYINGKEKFKNLLFTIKYVLYNNKEMLLVIFEDITELETQRRKAEKLLLNILPVRVADDLKSKGKTTPESFEEVSVYFSDIVGFTKMSSELDPKFLIDELNTIFTAFDEIMEKFCCERIKTIGDAYMAVCGMPMRNARHAENIANSAIEIINYINTRNENSSIKWRIRIGIHSGKVVGGVVGIKKYIYDIFGDTINTASRMESNSKPMKINVSDTTYQLLKDQFDFTDRGSFWVKGKGEMKMYFLHHKKFSKKSMLATTRC